MLAVTFSADGCAMAVASLDNAMMLWDIADPAVPKDLAADPARHACAISGRGLNADEWGRYRDAGQCSGLRAGG